MSLLRGISARLADRPSFARGADRGGQRREYWSSAFAVGESIGLLARDL